MGFIRTIFTIHLEIVLIYSGFSWTLFGDHRDSLGTYLEHYQSSVGTYMGYVKRIGIQCICGICLGFIWSILGFIWDLSRIYPELLWAYLVFALIATCSELIVTYLELI